MEPQEPFAMAPPTEPGEIERPRTQWPMVVGVISIVLGSLGVLGGLCGTIGQLFMGTLMSMAEDPEAQKMAGAMAAATPYQATSGVMMLIAAALLLASGIGLVRRRRWGVKLSVVWAVVRIVFAVAQAVLAYLAHEAMMRELAKDPSIPLPPGMMWMGGLMGAAIGLVWGVAYPAFVLIWLNRRAVKEETAEWP
jgi:hypothetical protein